MNERRQNVRVRPAADYDIRVDYVDGLVSVRLQVLDLALGGMGLVVDELFAEHAAGESLELRITFPQMAPFTTRAEIRHTSGKAGGVCGIRLGQLTDEQAQALRRAVGELQERGHSA
jgi:c-di-GMP-binding flagellar brake protein YcgR